MIEQTSRANIFLFQDPTVKQLIDDQIVDADAFSKLAYKRNFMLERSGNKRARRIEIAKEKKLRAADKQFSMIQIRDLQLLMLDKLCKGKAKPPLLVCKNLEPGDDEAIMNQVMEIVKEHSDEWGINPGKLDIQIHVATGSLEDDAKKSSILYPSKEQYTRAITALVFPGVPVDKLPANPYLLNRFETQRGERGHVRSSFSPHLTLQGSEHPARVTLFTHGDSRYLPHYQTASGFIVAMEQNNVYAEIYRFKSFKTLFEWAKTKKLVAANDETHKIYNNYLRLYRMRSAELNAAQNRDDFILESFQAELFQVASRDVIEGNKEKVGAYFNQLHQQELDVLATKLPAMVDLYAQKSTSSEDAPKRDDFSNIKPSLAAIFLLNNDNTDFLREILPQILNTKVNDRSDADLLALRDAHVDDYERLFSKTKEINPLEQMLLRALKYDSNTLHATVLEIANDLIANKSLHIRAALGFFKGLHSDEINAFQTSIQRINPTEVNAKIEIILTLLKFHKQLTRGQSVRTLKELDRMMLNSLTPVEHKGLRTQ